ncbi:putative ABC transport system permease protein [Geobacillus thermodenitrificans]|uniref:ABC transporter permease n=1 Tax=Geobacillus thermodenitrificans TaxID=33940 RepID=UPI002DFD28FC|nr:putative ABC transport system permease protein [Geobacillus thermodenitrificans]
MRSYKQLTWKYLKASKKRTALTILGITLSVSLISAIGLFLFWIQQAEIEETKQTKGAYHVMFTKLDSDTVNKVIHNPNVSRYGFFTIDETVSINEKVTVTEYIATNRALELLPTHVKKGRLPKNETEAALEEWLLKQIDPQATVGSRITLQHKQYTVSGILGNDVENQISNKGILLSKTNKIDETKASLLVEISEKADLEKTVNELKKLSDDRYVQLNTKLLILQGAGGDNEQAIGLYAVVAIIIGIVVISTIAIIYNSFQIGIVERIKQFGLLRAIGATPKQIRAVVIREATFLSLIGIPLGLLCGLVAIYGIFFASKLIANEALFATPPIISRNILLLSAAIGLTSIYVSAWLPARFAGSISPLAAISSRALIVKERIKKRKNRWIGKWLGFEGMLAAKNMKRDRKRYRITVFSITISVMLFIVFKSFMDMAFTISEHPNESRNIHFSIVKDTPEAKETAASISAALRALPTVDKVYEAYESHDFYAIIDKESELKAVQPFEGIYQPIDWPDGEKIMVGATINIYDSESLKAARRYLEAGNIDEQQLTKENTVIVIKNNEFYNDKTKKFYNGPIAHLQPGDEIYLEKDVGQRAPVSHKDAMQKVKVAAVVEDDPFHFRSSNPSRLKLITTKTVAERLLSQQKLQPVQWNIKLKTAESEKEAEKQIEAVIRPYPSVMLINHIDTNRKAKSSILMLQILVYGFIIVVSFIGSVNIINTLTTNILLRKRELASLQAIGLTNKGLKKMMVLEGVMYGTMGTLYGSIIGCGLSYLMYMFFIDVKQFSWQPPWTAMLIAGAAAVVIAYLSVLPPLARMKKEHLIEAIREEY